MNNFARALATLSIWGAMALANNFTTLVVIIGGICTVMIWLGQTSEIKQNVNITNKK